MASIYGDWFHSRSSSNPKELLKVRTLVFESQKPEYAGFVWSGGRHDNPKMYRFAETVNIQPSTMQTKILAMIRFGFIKHSNKCPLVWTRIGILWNDLYTVGNCNSAKKIYELTLTISLAIYAFNDSPSQYSVNPANGDMPLKLLFNLLDNNNSISLQEFKALVDGDTNRKGENLSYWKTDLINSGLFEESNGRLLYTGKYHEFIQEIKNFKPDPILTDEDWINIRENPLIEISPFKDSIRTIFETIIQDQNIEEQMTDGVITEPIVEAISEQEESQIPELDILNNDLRFSQSTRRIRNATWAIRIKRKYNYTCVVPNCDVEGSIFVEASHIKPDNAPDGDIPHRAHILNGLCLCKHCHVIFDRGYFSLSDDHKIITSSKFYEIHEQSLKRVILSSQNIEIKKRNDDRMPLLEFIQYHRNNYFKG